MTKIRVPYIPRIFVPTERGPSPVEDQKGPARFYDPLGTFIFLVCLSFIFSPLVKMRTSFIFSIPFLWSATVNAYANPLACSGVCVNAHDPTIIRRDDGRYFRFSTGGRIAIHSAPSLTGPWEYRGAAIPSGSTINKPGRNDLWAPDVTKVGNTYYLYYSVSTFGSQDSAIGVATSTDLDVNTWTDRGSSGVVSSPGSPYNAIDGQLLIDGSNLYMNFGSFWNDLYQVQMSNPPTGVARGSTSRQIAFKPEGEHAQEAAYVYKNGNYYYLFFSAGKCCGYDANRPAPGEEYKIQVCRSNSATGPFVSQLIRWLALAS